MPTVTLVDTTSTQTMTNKTLTAPTITSASVTLAAAPTTTLEAATKGYVDGLNTTPLLNASLAASVSSNALTLSLKTAGGSTPSATDPVRVTFRNGTDADGSLVTRTVTGATTLTFASGSTLGTSNGVAARIWVGLVDNAGTPELCAWNPLTSTGLVAFTPNTDVTTTAEGSGTATSAGTLYSTSARSTVPFVLLGFIEATEATAGVWATSPSVVQTYRDGMRKTGDIVQVRTTVDGAYATGTTVVPNDNTTPQNTEGTQFLSQAITPTSTINQLRIHVIAQAAASANSRTIMGLFQDSTANALASACGYSVVIITPVVLLHWMTAGTTSATTFKVRIGCTSSGTLYFNGEGGALYNSTLSSRIEVSEVYV